MDLASAAPIGTSALKAKPATAKVSKAVFIPVLPSCDRQALAGLRFTGARVNEEDWDNWGCKKVQFSWDQICRGRSIDEIVANDKRADLPRLSCAAILLLMSINLVQEEIELFLSDDEAGVLVIAGKWGVGKTFAWNRFLLEAKQKARISYSHYA